jgi:hypothetical protein
MAEAVASGILSKALIALIPLGLGALSTIAWQNSHALTALRADLEHLTVDYERTKASLEPGRTIMLRFEQNEKELAHLRALVEKNLACVPADRR